MVRTEVGMMRRNIYLVWSLEEIVGFGVWEYMWLFGAVFLVFTACSTYHAYLYQMCSSLIRGSSIYNLSGS